jgi:adenosylmethionine---8-amino-7-oxononanoate aminotransferase
MTLPERDHNVIWHPYTQMKTAGLPVAIVKGEGAYLFDDKGSRYIDAISSWWVNLHGHSHPYIAEKMSAQLRELEHVIFAGFTHRPAVELAERLLPKLPGSQSRVFYSDNGSTAVEVALKMAFQYWHNKGELRRRVVAFKEAYHGDTFGAMAVSGRGAFTDPFVHFLFDVHVIDVPVSEKGESLMQMEELIGACGSEIAAFIYEPCVQGTAGMKMYDPNGLSELLKLCKAHGIITIADEVMTGFGRTGKLFASEYIPETPDVFCLSKGLTGGTMAMGVTTCTKEIYEAFLSDDRMKTFFHGHSYTANPLACTAALASLDLLERKECKESMKRISDKLEGWRDELSAHERVSNARCLGTIMAFEVNTGQSTSYFNNIRDRAYNYFIGRGILIRPLGNVIYVMPPYCTGDDDLNYIYDSIRSFLDEVH